LGSTALFTMSILPVWGTIMQHGTIETHPDYQAALDYMYSFINYENKMPTSVEHVRFNHDRMRWLLKELGDPQQHFRGILVAGTKGKGSTAAMIEAMLRAAGYRTGFYSSPHLHSWRERIQVDRRLISQADVVRLTGSLRDLIERMPASLGPPTTFEIATTIGFQYFADVGIDLAVLEIGLGGRHDSVNVVEPDLSVITPISFDHVAVLGPTLREIASAKAGIIKSGVPAIIAPQQPEALAVLQAEAAGRAPLWLAAEHGIQGLQAPVQGLSQPYPIAISLDDLGLRGVYQLENARLAMGAVMLLSTRGLEVPPAAFAEGLRTVAWPGRFEVVPGSPTVVIDGAMNGASAARLRSALGTIPHERMILVIGTSRDKDIASLAAELVPWAYTVVVTRSRHPRSADQQAIVDAIQPFLRGAVVITDDIPPALEQARAVASPHDLICVTGSLFVAAAAREALGLADVID
jgi:dihydrofolate synthase / folylpolyglutamate synthase